MLMILSLLVMTLKSIEELKTFLQGQFHTKNLGQFQYFFSIKVVGSKEGINLSQRKYVLGILKDISFDGSQTSRDYGF